MLPTIGATIDLGPGLVALLTPVAAAIATYVANRHVRREVKPNGGSSMRDAVDRIERRLDAAGLPDPEGVLPPPSGKALPAHPGAE